MMEKIEKSYLFLIAAALFMGVLLLSACGDEQATSTPVQPTITPAQAGLGVDSTFPPFATKTDVPIPIDRESATPTTIGIPGGILTAIARTTPTTEVLGQIMADIDFRPNPDGYSFENYAGKKKNGKPVPELFVDDLQKMFGDAEVCVKVENGICTPRQEALDWLAMVNSQVPGGHCEGMAVSSLLFFKDLDTPSNYGDAAETTYDLQFADPIKRVISYYYYLQYVDPVATDYFNEQQIKPSEVLDKVIASMQNGDPDPVNLGFYGGPLDKDGYQAGHSITPYSVEDRGNGIYWIHVYDNNWPNLATAYMEINRNNETWAYDLSAKNPDYKPEVWEGDADTKTLAALPLSDRTGTLICPWCDDSSGGGLPGTSSSSTEVFGSALKTLAPNLSLVNSTVWSGQGSTAQGSSDMQVILQGDGSLLIENSKGQKLGYDGTKLVKDIPGGRVIIPRAGPGVAVQPVYFVPRGDAYNITLNGQAVQAGATGTSSLSLFGQGMAVTVQDIQLNRGDQHKLSISADSQTLSFVSGNNSSAALKPTFRISTTVKSGAGALLGGTTSYQFQLGNVDLTKGQQLDFSLSKPTGELDVKATGGSSSGSRYDLDIIRAAENGTQAFSQKNVSLNTNDTHQFNFGNWKTQPVSIDIDHGSTGKIMEKQPVPSAPLPTPTPEQ